MKQILTIVAIVALLIPMSTLAYTVQPGDTPYELWGANWAEEMEAQVGHSNATQLPVGIEVDLEQEELGGINNKRYYWSPESGDDTIIKTIADRTISVPNTIYSNLITVVTATSTEVLTDGTFANWNTYLNPDDWEISGFGESTDYTKSTRSTDSNAGTYALLSEVYTDFGGFFGGNALMSYNILFSADQTIQLSANLKNVSGTGYMGVYYTYEDGEDDYYYNFSGANVGTWTIPPGGMQGADQTFVMTPGTSDYELSTATEATSPSGIGVESGTVYMLPLGSSSGDTFLIDDVAVLVDSVDVVSNGDFELWTATLNTGDPLEYWGTVSGVNWDDETTGIFRTSTANTGSYSVSLISNGSCDTTNANKGYVYQSYTGVSTTELTATVYNKMANNAQSGGASYIAGGLVFLDSIDSNTLVWNFTSSAWDATSTAILDLGTDYIYDLSTSTDWTLSTVTTTIPSVGTIVMALVNQGGGDSATSYFFDDAELLLSLDDTEVSIDEPYPLVRVNSANNSSILTLGDDLLNYCSTSSTFFMTIKDIASNANSNNIVLSPESGTIDGASSSTIAIDYDWRTFFCDGTDYFITSQK